MEVTNIAKKPVKKDKEKGNGWNKSINTDSENADKSKIKQHLKKPENK